MTEKTNPIFKRKPFPQFFREWRKYRGYTQEELAEIMGVSAPAISQLENNKQGWTDTTLDALAEALACTPADLLIRNPMDDDSGWEIYRRVQQATPEKRKLAVAIIDTLMKEAS